MYATYTFITSATCNATSSLPGLNSTPSYRSIFDSLSGITVHNLQSLESYSQIGIVGHIILSRCNFCAHQPACEVKDYESVYLLTLASENVKLFSLD